MDEFLNAIEQGNAAEVRAYLAADPMLANGVDTRIKAPINLAQKGFILLADAIPEDMQKPRPPKPSTDTALHVAARHGRTEIARLLVEHGARVDAVNVNRRTALHEACIRGNLELAEFLIASGTDVNAQSANGSHLNATINHHFSAQHMPLVELLLKHGADVNLGSSSGWTPLHRALFYGRTRNNVSLAEILIRHGADVNLIPHSGASGTLLRHVASYGNAAIARMLIDAGADVNYSLKGTSFLHRAARHGHAEVVELLLARGANPLALDGKGNTPLGLTEEHVKVLEILERHAEHSLGRNQ